MLLTFKVNKQLIRRTDCEIPVAKSENYLYAQFTFSDEWEGTKTAIFNNGTPYSIILGEDNKCLVPWEVITASGFSVSVFCGQRITANVEFVGVLPTGYIEGQTPEPPTPTVYDQIIEELNGKLEPENIIAGDNITITVNGKNVTISSTSGTIDAYTKSETDALLDEKQDTLTAGAGISISEQNVISATAGINIEVVQALPSTGDTQTIYLVPNSGSAPNIYDEYIYVNNAWEKIGTTEVDLSNYYTKTETNTLLNAKADASALASKLDTNQGSANEGKVMTVGADGSLTPQTAQGTTYTAGQNISISAQNVISAGIEVIEI